LESLLKKSGGVGGPRGNPAAEIIWRCGFDSLREVRAKGVIGLGLYGKRVAIDCCGDFRWDERHMNEAAGIFSDKRNHKKLGERLAMVDCAIGLEEQRQ